MFSADLDFHRQSEIDNQKRQAETLIWDEIVDDFSTDEESIEILNSTSRAYGEATGARPRTGNQSGKPGHYTKETVDRKFKKELRRRNKQEEEENRKREKTEERLRKLKEWDINHWNEITAMAKAKMEILRAKAHKLERKKARSARRAAIHSRPRNREKIRIPAPPGEEDKSSETYYTSTTELSDTSSDSIPEIIDPENEH